MSFDPLYTAGKADKPIKAIEVSTILSLIIVQEKWKLVPAFLRLRGLVKQHIDSYNYFINHSIKGIVETNALINSDAGGPDYNFWLKFTNIKVGYPKIKEEDGIDKKITPHECRVRDMTYSAPMFVDVEYMRGNQINKVNDVPFGFMPMMLGASNCWLADKDHD